MVFKTQHYSLVARTIRGTWALAGAKSFLNIIAGAYSNTLCILLLQPDRVSVNVSIDGLTSQEDMTDHGTIFVQVRVPS